MKYPTNRNGSAKALGSFLLLAGGLALGASLFRLVQEFHVVRSPVVAGVIGYDTIKTRAASAGLKHKPCVLFTYEYAGHSFTGRDCSVSYRASKHEAQAMERARALYAGEVTAWLNPADPTDTRLRKSEAALWLYMLAASAGLIIAGSFLVLSGWFVGVGPRRELIGNA